jgi:hypothetical protein
MTAYLKKARSIRNGKFGLNLQECGQVKIDRKCAQNNLKAEQKINGDSGLPLVHENLQNAHTGLWLFIGAARLGYFVQTPVV